MKTEHLLIADAIKDWHKFYCKPDSGHAPISEKFIQDLLFDALMPFDPSLDLIELLAACGYEKKGMTHEKKYGKGTQR